MKSSYDYRKISRQKVLVCDLVKEMMLMQGDWYGMKEGPLVFNLGQGDLFARKSLPRKILPRDRPTNLAHLYECRKRCMFENCPLFAFLFLFTSLIMSQRVPSEQLTFWACIWQREASKQVRDSSRKSWHLVASPRTS